MKIGPSRSLPTLPQELTERAVDYLWDEPLDLVSCSLVCRAWYHATKHHLADAADIKSNVALRSLAHILVGKRMPCYGQIFSWLILREDTANPYLHTFPILIPGSFCPNVRDLNIVDINWAAEVSPHCDFFTYLTFYTSVLFLRLARCHFRNANQLHKLVQSLPNLHSLSLDRVTLASESGFDTSWGIARRSALARGPLGHLAEVTVCGDASLSSRTCMHRDLLDFAVPSACLCRLTLDVRYFVSPRELECFLITFPALTYLQLQYDPPWPTSSHVAMSYSPHGVYENYPRVPTRTPALRRLSVTDMRSASATWLLAWISTAWPCDSLENLSLSLIDTPSPALQKVFTHLLCLSSATLKSIFWRSPTTGECLGVDRLR